MNKKNLLMALIIFCAISACAEAEEFLHKGEATYLGWQTSNEQFVSCNRKIHKIGDGKIEKTTEKCPKDRTPGPIMFTGTVKEVNQDAMTFKVSKEGKVYNFFYPEEFAEKGSASFSDIKAGNTVTVFSKGWNRVENVKLINK